MLQRIYGTAFFNRKESSGDPSATLLEEARQRDHRQARPGAGPVFFSSGSAGQPFFHPEGALVYNLLVDHVRELYRRYGYDEVLTPQIFDASLWNRSGHYEHYASTCTSPRSTSGSSPSSR